MCMHPRMKYKSWSLADGDQTCHMACPPLYKVDLMAMFVEDQLNNIAYRLEGNKRHPPSDRGSITSLFWQGMLCCPVSPYPERLITLRWLLLLSHGERVRDFLGFHKQQRVLAQERKRKKTLVICTTVLIFREMNFIDGSKRPCSGRVQGQKYQTD